MGFPQHAASTLCAARTRGPMSLIQECHRLRAAMRACRDRSALLMLKSAANIFRSRLIIQQARDRIDNMKSWRAYRNKKS